VLGSGQAPGLRAILKAMPQLATRPSRALALAGALLFAALAGAPPTAAEPEPRPGGGGPRFGIDAFVGTPSAFGDAFRSVFFGASLRYIVSPNLELSLDYAFMDVGYYYPEDAQGDSWAGPVPWSSMPERYEGMRSSWIFYHTRHFLAPQLWYLAPLDRFELPLALRVGAGPAFSFLVANDAADYYPGLAEAYALFKKDFEAYLGLSLRLGLEYRPGRFWRLGLEYLFIVDSFSGLADDLGRYGFGYVERSGNLLAFVGARL